jgi:isocitrate dehydrogenase
MEYPRMVRHLKEIVNRSYSGKKQVRVMDIEAVKEALERFEEIVPDPSKKSIGF